MRTLETLVRERQENEVELLYSNLHLVLSKAKEGFKFVHDLT